MQPDTSGNSSRYYRGHYNLLALLETLVARSSPTEVLLAGCSSGGIGVFLKCDIVAQVLAPDAKCVGCSVGHLEAPLGTTNWRLTPCAAPRYAPRLTTCRPSRRYSAALAFRSGACRMRASSLRGQSSARGIRRPTFITRAPGCPRRASARSADRTALGVRAWRRKLRCGTCARPSLPTTRCTRGCTTRCDTCRAHAGSPTTAGRSAPQRTTRRLMTTAAGTSRVQSEAIPYVYQTPYALAPSSPSHTAASQY